jgi:hypothetical protein
MGSIDPRREESRSQEERIGAWVLANRESNEGVSALCVTSPSPLVDTALLPERDAGGVRSGDAIIEIRRRERSLALSPAFSGKLEETRRALREFHVALNRQQSSLTRSVKEQPRRQALRRRLFWSGVPLFRLSAGSNGAFSFRYVEPEEQLSALICSCPVSLARANSRRVRSPYKNTGRVGGGRRGWEDVATISCAADRRINNSRPTSLQGDAARNAAERSSARRCHRIHVSRRRRRAERGGRRGYYLILWQSSRSVFAP